MKSFTNANWAPQRELQEKRAALKVTRHSATPPGRCHLIRGIIKISTVQRKATTKMTVRDGATLEVR